MEAAVEGSVASCMLCQSCCCDIMSTYPGQHSRIGKLLCKVSHGVLSPSDIVNLLLDISKSILEHSVVGVQLEALGAGVSTRHVL